MFLFSAGVQLFEVVVVVNGDSLFVLVLCRFQYPLTGTPVFHLGAWA